MSQRGPHFLCIGAPKAGTTWLYAQLARHPEVWVPTVKELHYFDWCHPVERVGNFADQRRGLLGLHRAHPRRRILRAYAKALRSADPARVAWVWRYLEGPRNDQWYLDLFPSGRRSGEFTTDYSSLDEAGVAHVKRLLPECRVIFLMRDPVKRAWSHARMVLPMLLGRSLDTLRDEDFERYLEQAAARRRGDYPTTIGLWESAFPAGQLMFDFYDRISDAPASLFADVQSFLQLTPARSDAHALSSRVNEAKRSRFDGIPPAIQRTLARMYLGDLEWLASRFPEPAGRWLRDAEHVLGG